MINPESRLDSIIHLLYWAFNFLIKSIYMRFLNSLFILFVFITAGTTLQSQVAPPAQPELLTSEDVSDQDVNSFVDALQFVQEVQQESQPKMVKAIQDEGLEPQQFIQASQAMQQGKETGLDDEDQKKFETVQKKVQDIQVEANGQIESKIKEQDMTMEKFNQLFLSYQQNPELQQRIEDKMKEISKWYVKS